MCTHRQSGGIVYSLVPMALNGVCGQLHAPAALPPW